MPARFHLWTGIGLLAVVALYYLINRSSLSSGTDRELLITLGHASVALVGVHLCYTGVKTEKRELSAMAPMILGMASIVYSLASVTSLLERMFAPERFFPFPSDILTAMCPLLIAAAILIWPTRQIPRLALPKILADALIFFFGLSALVWTFLIGPLYQNSKELTLVGTVLTGIYPLTDLLMIVLLVMAIWRGVQAPVRPATWLIAACVLALTLGDTFFTLRRSVGFLTAGTPIDVMWPFACVVCNMAGGWLRYAMATWPEQMDPDRSHWARPSAARWMQASPTLFLPFCVGLLAYALNNQPSHYVINGLYFFLFFFMVAVVAHQLLAVYENNQLYDGLNNAYMELGRSRSKLAEQYDELEEANSRLARLALIDGLTGLWNHRAFYEELERAQRELPAPLAVLLADVDFFKQYNDEFGHPAGDRVLRDVGRAIRDALPMKSFAAKFGGDEFAVLLRGDNAKAAATIADQVRAAVAGCPVSGRPVTISVGYTEWRISMGIDEVVEAADRSLYAAKSIGKNMVYGGMVRDLPALAMVDAGGVERVSDDPMLVGRVIVDAMRCDPTAVELEPNAPLVGGLLATLEMADPDTRRHSERVMWFSLSFGAKLVELGWKLTREDFRALAYGALLHDIGKIKIPANVLRSSKPLDRAGRELMNAHPILGADMVAPFSDLEQSLDVIRCHHEQWDGKGYPLGLTGDEIPLRARIFSIVDAMDAMGSNRAYKHALEWDAIVEELRYQTGRHFDPDLVEPFLDIPKEHWDSLRRTQYRIVAPLAGHK